MRTRCSCFKWIGAGFGLLAAGALIAGWAHFIKPSAKTPFHHAAAAAKAPTAKLPVFNAKGEQMFALDDARAGESELASAVRREMKTLAPSLPNGERLRIYSTIDPELQSAAEKAAQRQISLGEAGQPSFVALENNSGAVRVLIGVQVPLPLKAMDLAAEPAVRALAEKSENTADALTLASACSVLPNGGLHRPPFLITRIESEDGAVVYRHEEAPERTVLRPDAAWQMASEFLTSPTAPDSEVRSAAGLEGANWYAGYTTSLTCVASFQQNVVGVISAKRAALPMWSDFMGAVPAKAYPALAFQAPEPASPDEIPLYRPAVPASPVPSIAFAGTPRVERAFPVDPSEEPPVRVMRALPVQPSDLQTQRSLSAEVFDRGDSGPWAEGNGFRVGPRSVRVMRALPVN